MNIEERLLTINPMSLTGIKQDIVKNIIIHYVNNPGLSAIQRATVQL